MKPAIDTRRSRQTADPTRLSKDTHPNVHMQEIIGATTQSSLGIHEVLQNGRPAPLLAQHEERHRIEDRQLQGLPGEQAQQSSEHNDATRSFKR